MTRDWIVFISVVIVFAWSLPSGAKPVTGEETFFKNDAESMGIRGFVKKPLSKDELAEAVRRVLDTKVQVCLSHLKVILSPCDPMRSRESSAPPYLS